MYIYYKDGDTVIQGSVLNADAARGVVPDGVEYIVRDELVEDMDALDFTNPDGYGDPESYWAAQTEEN